MLFRWALIGSLASALSATADTLVVFGDDAYAPVVYKNEAKVAGVLPAILARASEITKDTYDVRLFPWKRAYELAARGEGGVVGVSYTAERATVFDFSRAIYEDNIQIVTLKGKEFPFARLDDLKGKVVGGVNGASYGQQVDAAIGAGLFKVDRDVSQSGRLRKLLTGRLDAAFIGNGVAGFNSVIAAAPDLMKNEARFAILPTPLTKDPLHLAFPKSMNKREATRRFDAAIEQLHKSGELGRILAKNHP